ncbi:MAG: NfeD family protein, partial [Gemmataceae bacterium]
DITRNRYPTVLIRKLFDPNLEVARSGGKFVEAKGLAGGEQLVGGLSAGEPAIFTFPLARDVGLCQQMSFASLEEVRTAYGLPRLGPQQSLDRAICWRIPLEGQVNGEMVEQTKRRVDRALRARANLLIFELKCSGGSSDKAAEIGQYLASLRDRPGETPVETIAFVTTKARNLATFIAFGCNKIVMQLENPDDVKAAQPDEEEDIQVHEARLGGFGVYMNQHPTLEPIRRELSLLPPNTPAEVRDPIEARLREATAALEQTLQNQLGDIAEKQRYPVVLTTAMFNREQRIHWVERAKGAAGGRVLLSELEFQEDQRGPRLYREVSLVKPWQGQARFDHRYLTLTAQQAREIGVSQHTVKDFTELCEVEGLISDQVKTAEADWLDSLGDFLRDPWTSVILVMIGITCLILELKMPGVGLPGVLSAICFVLFFWAHSQLHGQITWLAILLFLLGLLLLGLEIFIIPGFGVCGISGVLLVLASLGLVAYGHWPRTGSEWVRFGNQISPFGISMIGSLFLVFLIVRYLPNIPVLNRLMLQPLDENGDHQALDEEPMNSEYHRLLGAIGHAATPLRPAGKMQVEGRFVDVMAEGAYIMAGARVQVIEIEGNRVVVKEV